MVTISMPKMASTDMAMGVVGAAGGILGSEYLASSVVSATRLAGNAALATSLGTKLAMGVGSFMAAERMTGTGTTVLGLFGMGSLASMAIDVIDRMFPKATEAGASLRARFAPTRVAAPIRVRPAPAAAPVAVPVAAREFR